MKRSNAHKNIVGQTFGQLTVLKDTGKNKHNNVVWECLCACGTRVEIITNMLVGGAVKSCGCLRRRKGSDSPTWKGHGEIGGHR